MKKIISLLIVISMVFGIFPINCFASQNEAGNKQTNTEYIAEQKSNSKKIVPIVIKATSDGNELYGINNVAICDKNSDKLEYRFDVVEDAIYTLVIDCAFPKKNIDASFSLQIDGEFPFLDAKEVTLKSLWENIGSVREDDFGNQITPEQGVVEEFHSQTLKTNDGSNQIYLFDLKKGTHTLTLYDFINTIAFSSFTFKQQEVVGSYEEVATTYKNNNYKNYLGEAIILEGEAADIKSDRTLVPLSDSSDPEVSPSNSKVTVLNYIGSSNWQTTGQTLTWKFKTDTEGLYKLGFKFRQNGVTNGNVYRAILIDGKIPFSQASAVEFSYDSSWQYKELTGSDGKELLVYFSKGEHTISLEVTMGGLQDEVIKLQSLTEEIGALYRKIVMVTGETVDANRDYNLFEQIPDFNEKLKKYYDSLESIKTNILKISNNSGGADVSAISNMSRIISTMFENSYTAHKYVNSYYSYYCSLASYVYTITQLPLDIDFISISQPGQETQIKTANVFKKFLFGLQKFVYSYSKDYNSISKDSESAKSITIWVNWGRDQAQVLNSLIQTTFTAETGIDVNVHLTDATLIQGILSGNGPDCALHLARSQPINYAMRGVLYDLSNFKDYDTVMDTFLDGSGTPYEYEGGHYALPDTITFYMMFCRTDILEELGITPPKTWDEFLEATAIVQRNNLQVNIGGGQANIGTNLLVYSTMLLQNGGKFYNDKLDSTALSDKIALETFDKFTDYYTDYKVPITADFYNRFRTGIMPIGIQPYSMYMTLSVAAPEINGKWCMLPIPGEIKENGVIDNTQTPTGTGCSILSASKNKDESWEFLKWWTSADTQLSYSENLESILGTAGRVMTSNKVALSGMTWDKGSYEQLEKQMDKLVELPELPGGYYISRIIDQAFHNTVSNNQNPQDVLLKWSDIANSEIKRKRQQYGLD